MTAFVGEDVRMSCETSGDPEPQVTWFLEEIAIETLMDERFEVSENGNELLVQNVNLRDAGSYRCVAANVNGLKSAQGRLRVVGMFITWGTKSLLCSKVCQKRILFYTFTLINFSHLKCLPLTFLALKVQQSTSQYHYKFSLGLNR